MVRKSKPRRARAVKLDPQTLRWVSDWIQMEKEWAWSIDSGTRKALGNTLRLIAKGVARHG